MKELFTNVLNSVSTSSLIASDNVLQRIKTTKQRAEEIRAEAQEGTQESWVVLQMEIANMEEWVKTIKERTKTLRDY